MLCESWYEGAVSSVKLCKVQDKWFAVCMYAVPLNANENGSASRSHNTAPAAAAATSGGGGDQ